LPQINKTKERFKDMKMRVVATKILTQNAEYVFVNQEKMYKIVIFVGCIAACNVQVTKENFQNK
jgi:hypothetical protein